MNQSAQLYQLQKIDSELDQTNNRLKEIEKILAEDESVQAADRVVKDCIQQQHKAQRDLREIEENAKAIAIKISTSESSLYGGKIRNPKELQDLQGEIASLKKRLAALEDEQLEAMVVVEGSDEDYKSAQGRLEAAKANFANMQAGLFGERTNLKKQCERLGMERQATITSISADNLAAYNHLRTSKRGLAVSRIEDDSCHACGTEIRPAERQLAKSSLQIAFCSSCGRILFAG
ncbi:MAG: hypothetical protein GYA17_10650 [Chloroflexi bacterium]|nr:hypothetical protein [Chloroflexota bacterium]